MLPARLQFARQLGVGQQWTAHGDEVGAPVGQDPFGRNRIVDAADGDHRHVDHLLDRGRGSDIDRVAVVGAIDHPGDESIDDPAADMECSYAGGHEFRCHPRGVEYRPAPGDALVPGDAQRNRQGVADLRPDRGQCLQHHANPAARRVAPIVVGAPIALWGKEGAEQHVAVRGVQLYSVVSGLGRTAHRGLEQVEHLGQLLSTDLG